MRGSVFMLLPLKYLLLLLLLSFHSPRNSFPSPGRPCSTLLSRHPRRLTVACATVAVVFLFSLVLSSSSVLHRWIPKLRNPPPFIPLFYAAHVEQSWVVQWWWFIVNGLSNCCWFVVVVRCCYGCWVDVAIFLGGSLLLLSLFDVVVVVVVVVVELVSWLWWSEVVFLLFSCFGIVVVVLVVVMVGGVVMVVSSGDALLFCYCS
ncbi:hypothetical protein BVRB_6g147570 [Beta vulgaris subsp. vulgaris]|nr:hypothetical protein BVRB_6g147570 [Beta vulgaris subsp. vulgaris]